MCRRPCRRWTVTLRLRDDVASLMEVELMVADKESGQALAERMQLLRCFGVDQVCLSDLRRLSADFTVGLR